MKCSKGHHWLHRKTIADIVEALVGAFIVDSGFISAIAFLKWIGIHINFDASQISEMCIASNSYMALSNNINTCALETSLGYKFRHKGLLMQAFVHPSFNKHIGGCYQRLEFLGDAVLDYLITSYLFSVYPNLKPGQLTDLRSVTVNNNVFAYVAVCRSFHTYLLSDSDALSEAVKKFVSFSDNWSQQQGVSEGPRCPKALGDLVESSVGAILLDSGFDLKVAWKIMLSFLDPIMSFSTLQLNPVRELTELCQSHNWDFEYSSSKKGGAFTVEACVTGKKIHCTGSGTNVSKKGAMRIAARQIFSKLKSQGYKPKKSNSLAHLLKTSGKKEAKLIGYDETPMPAVSFSNIHFENLNLQESPPGLINQSVNKSPNGALSRTISSTPSPGKNNPAVTVTNSQSIGTCMNASAKSRLYELCAVSSWKAPLFECVKEEGLSHLKQFTMKVKIEIAGSPPTIVEGISDPRQKKRAAEEHAAQGVLWYLQRQGYLGRDN